MNNIINIKNNVVYTMEKITTLTGNIINTITNLANIKQTTINVIFKMSQMIAIYIYKFYILRKNEIINNYNRHIPSEIKEIHMIEMNNNSIIRISVDLKALYKLVSIETNIVNTYYIIKVWNNNVLKTKEYILKENILKSLLTENISSEEFINNIYTYHGRYANNNIFSIIINNIDIMNSLQKLKLSIAIPENVSGNILLMYYYYINNKVELYNENKDSKIILIDYNLEEKELKLSDYIVNSA